MPPREQQATVNQRPFVAQSVTITPGSVDATRSTFTFKPSSTGFLSWTRETLSLIRRGFCISPRTFDNASRVAFVVGLALEGYKGSGSLSLSCNTYKQQITHRLD